ncbi:MAG: hypothetical protein VKJ06_06825 [Vampirovibrionales bacterium]|nr:hypothetical protein [Vampirovibrionales bacterium]
MLTSAQQNNVQKLAQHMMTTLDGANGARGAKKDNALTYQELRNSPLGVFGNTPEQKISSNLFLALNTDNSKTGNERTLNQKELENYIVLAAQHYAGQDANKLNTALNGLENLNFQDPKTLNAKLGPLNAGITSAGSLNTLAYNEIRDKVNAISTPKAGNTPATPTTPTANLPANTPATANTPAQPQQPALPAAPPPPAGTVLTPEQQQQANQMRDAANAQLAQISAQAQTTQASAYLNQLQAHYKKQVQDAQQYAQLMNANNFWAYTLHETNKNLYSGPDAMNRIPLDNSAWGPGLGNPFV